MSFLTEQQGEVTMQATAHEPIARRIRVERGIYRQPNGNYAVWFMHGGMPRFRTVRGDLAAARRERQVLMLAAGSGALAVSPRLRFASVAGRWLVRFEAKVAAGERCERTLEAHRYYLPKQLLPTLGRCLMRDDWRRECRGASTGLRAKGCSEKTTAGVLATLHSIVRFAIRNGWIVDEPVSKLEADERPHPIRRRQRVLGRDEIQRLLAAFLPRYRPLIATALYTGMRISQLLGLTWDDVDLPRGVIHVRVQLSRAHHHRPARRVPPKTPSAIRDIPLVPQLAEVLLEHQRGSTFAAGGDWVFATGHGTPLGHRNVERRALNRAARIAGLDGGDWPPLRFHDLRHTFASHLILDLGLDVAQVSRILGRSPRHDHARRLHPPLRRASHAAEIRARMAASAFAQLLAPDGSASDGAKLVALPGGRAT